MAVSTESPQRPHRTRRACAILLAFVILLAFGCKRDPGTPEETLRRFISDVRTHKADSAWAALSGPSQAELQSRAKALAQAAGEDPETRPERLLFEHLELLVLRAPEAISVASPIGREVVLRVSVEGGESANVKMVREGASWKVELAEALHPTRTATAAPPGP